MGSVGGGIGINPDTGCKTYGCPKCSKYETQAPTQSPTTDVFLGDGACTAETPCEVNHGDCDNDEGCAGDLVCVPDGESGHGFCRQPKEEEKKDDEVTYFGWTMKTWQFWLMVAGVAISFLALIVKLCKCCRKKKQPELNLNVSQNFNFLDGHRKTKGSSARKTKGSRGAYRV